MFDVEQLSPLCPLQFMLCTVLGWVVWTSLDVCDRLTPAGGCRPALGQELGRARAQALV